MRNPHPAVALSVTVLILGLLFVSISAFARDPGQVRKFRRAHPCPSTGRTIGACPGFVVDHIYPLCAGGDDAPGNMQWQEYRASLKKDAEERRLCRRIKGKA